MKMDKPMTNAEIAAVLIPAFLAGCSDADVTIDLGEDHLQVRGLAESCQEASGESFEDSPLPTKSEVLAAISQVWDCSRVSFFPKSGWVMPEHYRTRNGHILKLEELVVTTYIEV